MSSLTCIFLWFCLFFRSIYFKEHFPLTASVCIIVQDWGIFHIIFHGLLIFSFLLPQNKYTCFQKHVHYLSLRTLSWSGKNWTVDGFYPTYVCLLPHLVREKTAIIFLYFLLNNWAIGILFCTERILCCKMALKVLKFV